MAALRRAGLRLLAVAPVAVLCSLILTTYVTLRPQAISWLLLAVLLWVLISLRPRHGPWLLLLGPAFALWANLHGLYVVGLGVLAVYVFFTLIGRTAMSPNRWWLVAGSAAAVAGTVLTPAGLSGLLYPLRYLEAGDWGLGYIPEWNTPNFHEPAHLLLLLLLIGIGISGYRRSPGWLTVLAIVSIPASLLAMRSAPVAAVLAMPTLAYGLDAALGTRSARNPRRRPAADDPARRLLDLATAVIVGVVAWVTLAPTPLDASIRAETERRFPVASVDWLEAHEPDARVFAEYSWGGYVVYRLHDLGGTDFIDGRNDMFDQSILEDYSLIRAADPGWSDKLVQYGATAILLPPDAPITRGPAASCGLVRGVPQRPGSAADARRLRGDEPLAAIGHPEDPEVVSFEGRLHGQEVRMLAGDVGRIGAIPQSQRVGLARARAASPPPSPRHRHGPPARSRCRDRRARQRPGCRSAGRGWPDRWTSPRRPAARSGGERRPSARRGLATGPTARRGCPTR